MFQNTFVMKHPYKEIYCYIFHAMKSLKCLNEWVIAEDNITWWFHSVNLEQGCVWILLLCAKPLHLLW